MLLEQLQALEVELHQPEVRRHRERLEQLLHPEFYEIGRSGRTYDRFAIISQLCSALTQPIIAADAFSVTELSPDIALLTYRSAHVEPAIGLLNHTLRTSIWMKCSAGWRLRFHQGTAAAQTW